MRSAPENVAVAAAIVPRPERQISDFVYQAMTIAAMLWLLASLWAF